MPEGDAVTPFKTGGHGQKSPRLQPLFLTILEGLAAQVRTNSGAIVAFLGLANLLATVRHIFRGIPSVDDEA